MAEKSGFFNALLSGGDYDRTYNANDYSDNLAVVISNGVLRSTGDDLQVTASGLSVSVAPGRAWIDGHYYLNDSPFDFSATTPPVGGKRYDRVMLRLNLDITERRISLIYVEGVASNSPVKPAPTRNDSVYDLVLADIYVDTNATSLVVTDTRSDASLCGWVYSTSGDNSFFTSLDNSFMQWFTDKKDTLSSVTLFKRYTWSKVLTAQTSTVQFNIPQYDVDTCFVEVYVNGILDSRHSIEDDVITFEGSLVAGTKVIVNCYKSIDGTGIMTVADEITELQNAVATLSGVSKYTYKCTGSNDNISLSQIAQAIINKSYVVAEVTAAAHAFLNALGGNTYLASLEDDAQITIDVVGDLGVTTPYSGAGTSASPYKWFSFGKANAEGERIIFDFSKCNKFSIECSANTSNYIFYGADINIKGVNVQAYAVDNGTAIEMIKAGNLLGRVNCENCRFYINTSGLAQISEHGVFTNCYCYVASWGAAAYCFKPKSTGLIRLLNGEYYAYCLTSTGIGSAIMHTSSGDTDAVLLAENIHCPVVTKTNYSQGFLSVANAGNTIINGAVSRLTSSGSYNTITNLINKNKA